MKLIIYEADSLLDPVTFQEEETLEFLTEWSMVRPGVIVVVFRASDNKPFWLFKDGTLYDLTNIKPIRDFVTQTPDDRTPAADAAPEVAREGEMG